MQQEPRTTLHLVVIVLDSQHSNTTEVMQMHLMIRNNNADGWMMVMRLNDHDLISSCHCHGMSSWMQNQGNNNQAEERTKDKETTSTRRRKQTAS